MHKKPTIAGCPIKHSGYTPPGAFHGSGLKQIRAKLVKLIRESGIKFDAIAVRGNSGLLLGPLVATVLNKGLILVRKDCQSHASYTVEGCTEVKRYIIVDDLIESGKTIKEMRDKIGPSNLIKCVGVFLYSSDILSDRGYKRTMVPNSIPIFSMYRPKL